MSLCVTELGLMPGGADNSAAWAWMVERLPEGTRLKVPRGRFRFGAPIRLTRRLHLEGVGGDSVLELDPGEEHDGLMVGDGAARVAVQGIVWRDLCIHGARCRDTLVLELVHRSRFEHVWVCGGARYAAHLRGCLSNHLNLMMSTNLSLGGLVPRPGRMGGVRVGPPVGCIAANANRFDLLIEGGRYEPGVTAQLFGERQDGQGNNVVTGTVEGTEAGRSIELEGWEGASLQDLHVEHSDGVRLAGCQSAILCGGRYLGREGQDVPAILVEGCVQTVLDGLHATRVVIDAGSSLSEVRTVRTDRLDDASRSTSYTGASRRISEDRLFVGPPGTAANWLRNGGFADFDAQDGLPVGHLPLGSGVQLAQTGHGLADPVRRRTRHACRVEVAAAGEGLATRPVLAEGGEDGLGFVPGIGPGFVAVRAHVFLPAQGGSAGGVRFSVWVDDGSQVLLPALVTDTERWVEVAAAFPFKGQRFDLRLVAAGPGCFYLAELMAAPGTGLPRVWLPRTAG